MYFKKNSYEFGKGKHGVKNLVLAVEWASFYHVINPNKFNLTDGSL